jgi:hypothetical protein
MILTPKEKARELISKFQHPPSALEHTECDCLHIDIAKECALIAVDEILSINSVDKDEDLSNYWEQVKQEIEKR